MSAIFGIINKKGAPADNGAVNKVKLALAHRMTDGYNDVLSANAAFGHCKLFVSPLQAGENLPFETDSLIITADTKLYNRIALITLLGIEQHEGRAMPDSQLLLAAYQKWGEACVKYLEGEYVFAIWNKHTGQLFMATDHIGLRPVYYYNDADHFIFCSEIKGVVAAKTTPDYFNENHIIEYFYRQGNAAETYNKEVFALLGASILTVKDGDIKIRKYWTLERGKYSYTKDEDWLACLRDKMFKAVENRLVTERPAGVTLSGGLDSSSVASILSQLLLKKNRPLYAFSSVLPAGYKGIEADERKYIEIIGKHCPNIIQTYIEPENEDIFAGVENAFNRDECFPNAFFYIDQAILTACKTKGVRSVFSGFGGDFGVSWQGRSVIYELIKKGAVGKALHIANKLHANSGLRFTDIAKRYYIAYTKAYEFFYKLTGTYKQQFSQIPLQKSFLKKYRIMADARITGMPYLKNRIDSGAMGKYPATFANRGAWYDTESADPFLDKDIFELLYSMPLHIFLQNGQPRSAIRWAMEGVVPIDVLNRSDKMPYMPMFNTMMNKIDIAANSSGNVYFDKLFDSAQLTITKENITPKKNAWLEKNYSGIRFAQVIITNLSIQSLVNDNYIMTGIG